MIPTTRAECLQGPRPGQVGRKAGGQKDTGGDGVKPTFGSLFAGIGGLDLGLERAGWECRWQVEIDGFCQKVLHKHWPDVPKYRDICEVDFAQVEPVDMICGGFPCQPFSCAGKQQGEKDERYLWPEFARAISEAKPRWVLLENVPRLLGFIGEFGRVLGDLAGLGFDASWSLLSACSMGAPHTRERLFVVANSNRCDGVSGLGVFFGNPAIQARDHRAGAGDRVQTITERLRSHDGLSPYVDRRRCLGNAVYPDCAEWIGRRMIEAMS